jgi:hypothetical protein
LYETGIRFVCLLQGSPYGGALVKLMVVHGQRELPCDFDIVRDGFHAIRIEPQLAINVRLDDGGSWRD